ncbi:uncharacterized protein ACB057_017685 [Neosynchiropus ocellatus]
MEYHSGGSLPLLGRPRYCPGATANGGYLCETGHCCGESGCCTYYYELWWFWLLWTVLILFSCCCAYRHRRAKQRVQQQQRQREISLLAYHGANSFPSSMLDLSFLASLKLPSYEEVAAQPSTPPPPYSSVFTTPRYPQPPRTADPHLLTQHDPLLHHPLSDGPSSLSSDNSSSCSCDSCCPSSPCSSSLSVPLTYETDTSHASTPNDVAPLTLDSMETIAAVATRLEVNETRLAPDRRMAADASCMAAAAQEPEATDALNSHQTTKLKVQAQCLQRIPTPRTQFLRLLSSSEILNLNQPPTDAQIGTGASSSTPNLQTSTPVTCPAITIECESAFTHSTPGILSPSSGSPSPASSSCLQAPALLLDPLTMLHQSDKGGLSSPHTSSLSPSPRATQSPPKQTLFSPCVDVFEPEPASWEEGEGDQADEDDEEDMGADESQYRHRRLTGDSGIEVCRCRVEEDEDDEEEDEAEAKQKVKRAEVENNEGSFEIHDSVDCPARAPKTTGLAVTLCNSASTAKTSDDTAEVVIVMDTI